MQGAQKTRLLLKSSKWKIAINNRFNTSVEKSGIARYFFEILQLYRKK